MDSIEILKELCAAPGPAGFESGAVRAVKGLLPKSFREVHTDKLGSLIAVRRSGAQNAPLVLIDAHIDEIGLIVSSVDDGGFLKFAALGGADPRIMPDAEVLVLAPGGNLPGIICCLPPHVQSREQMSEFSGIDELGIDIGFGPEKARALVPAGTPAVFRGDFLPLAGERFASKALDNRISVAAALSALFELEGANPDFDIAFCASAQEESGCRGIRAAAFGLDPAAAIVLDATFGRDSAAPADKTYPMDGLTLCVGPETDRAMTERLFDLGRRLEIAVAPEVYGRSTGTNAGPLQITRAGVPTAVLSIPVKNMHSPCELGDASALRAAAKLLAAFLLELKAEDLA